MFDLAIIGAGPAGYVAAQRAAAAGLSVVLFEKNELGGVCLNEGCIPTKTLLQSAKILEQARSAEKYGVLLGESSLDYAKVCARKDKVTKKLVGAIRVSMRNLGVEVVKAEAQVLGGAKGDFLLGVKGQSAEGQVDQTTVGQVFHAAHILLCTGSRSFIPPIPGLEYPSEHILTSREALQIKEVPESLIIIGGGVIGMEFAALFNSLGCKVSVIEATPKILGPVDEEISSLLQSTYASKGVDFFLNSKVVRIEGRKLYFSDEAGEEKCLEGEKILVCVGRRAVCDGVDTEKMGLALMKGAVKTDSHMRTSVPGIYAAGDITGFSMLAHTASREAEVAVNDILGVEDEMSYKAVPGVVYTHPEVASVGESEQSLKAKGIDYEVHKLPMTYSGRFVVENERGNGLCKLLSSPEGRILGAHLLGDPSSEIISSCVIAIEKGMSLGELRRIIFPHPSVSEILKECSW